MAKPAIVKVNEIVFYLDYYLHDHKPPRDASREDKKRYAWALLGVETMKRMFMIPFPPGPGCKTPWYGGPISLGRFCKTPWMGKGPIAARRPRVGKLK